MGYGALSFIKSRLRRLEASARAGSVCPGCGLGPQQRGYIVLDGQDPAASLEIPEVCPECGRSTRVYINVVYEGEGA